MRVRLLIAVRLLNVGHDDSYGRFARVGTVVESRASTSSAACMKVGGRPTASALEVVAMVAITLWEKKASKAGKVSIPLPSPCTMSTNGVTVVKPSVFAFYISVRDRP